MLLPTAATPALLVVESLALLYFAQALKRDHIALLMRFDLIFLSTMACALLLLLTYASLVESQAMQIAMFISDLLVVMAIAHLRLASDVSRATMLE